MPAHDLHNFDGKKRSSDDQGEVFAPGLFEVQPDTLGDADGRIAEGSEADAAQHGVVKERSPVEDEVDEAAFRVEAQVAGNASENVADVLAHQPQGSHADRCK